MKREGFFPELVAVYAAPFALAAEVAALKARLEKLRHETEFLARTYKFTIYESSFSKLAALAMGDDESC